MASTSPPRSSAPPSLPAPVQALVNELTAQRDIFAQRAATYAMRLAACEAALDGVEAELAALRDQQQEAATRGEDGRSQDREANKDTTS
jgi:hypothetical protein